MANHHDLSNDELNALIETRLKEFLNRRPATREILDLVLNFTEVIKFSLYDAALEETVDEDMAREGYFKDAKGRYVKEVGYDEPKGGDTDVRKGR